MISNLAYVHPDARLGKDVIIEPFAYVAGNVIIGDGTWIGPNATIMDGARIGTECRIFPSAVVSGIPQDLKFRGEDTTAEIGENTTIREGVTVNRGTASAGKTIVGNGCLLMAYSHIGHDCALKNNIIIGNTTRACRRSSGRRLGNTQRRYPGAPVLPYRRSCNGWWRCQSKN